MCSLWRHGFQTSGTCTHHRYQPPARKVHIWIWLHDCCNFSGSYGDKTVVNAAARYREFRYDPQFVAWFMEREQVQAVNKNLTAFEKPKRADNDVPRLSSIGHSTCPNGDIRLTFAVFQALAVE